VDSQYTAKDVPCQQTRKIGQAGHYWPEML